jgi:hypothetical protein
MKRATLVVVGWAIAAPTFAQTPHVVNARLSTHAAQPDLARAINAIVTAQADPAWIGYTVPVLNRPEDSRFDGWSERCRLEQRSSEAPDAAFVAGPIKLEPSPTVMVLLRAQNSQLQRIRTLSSDCEVDAGGLPFHWFDAVNPAQSVAYLQTFISSAGHDLSEPALAAMAMHADRSASTALLDLARNGTVPRFRQRALVWIARRAESQASGVISDAIERDSDIEVKRQAVFALSQLPSAEGVPLLIKLAQSSTNPDVRKQAIHWLGQSKDPRALSFFEGILR